MQEQWRPVFKYESLYQISNHGSIRRLLADGKYRYISTKVDWRGYRTAHLSNKKAKTIKIHKMVLEAFDRPKPEGMQANHKDANKLNNHISNLEWVTPSENVIHSYKHGLQPDNRGENNGQSKLKPCEVIEIRRLYSLKISQAKISKMFRVSRSMVGFITSRHRWAHI